MDSPDRIAMRPLSVLLGASEEQIEAGAAAAGVDAGGGVMRHHVEAVRQQLRRHAIEGA